MLSDQPQIFFNYFRQQFAQVTNPAIDSIRENLVMSLTAVSYTHLDVYKRQALGCEALHHNRHRPWHVVSDVRTTDALASLATEETLSLIHISV